MRRGGHGTCIRSRRMDRVRVSLAWALLACLAIVTYVTSSPAAPGLPPARAPSTLPIPRAAAAAPSVRAASGHAAQPATAPAAPSAVARAGPRPVPDRLTRPSHAGVVEAVRSIATSRAATSKTSTVEAGAKSARGLVGPARDWVRAPAIVEHVAAGEVFAVSDLHGRYEESFRLFTGNRLMTGSVEHPASVEWIGGNATVVVVGDVINKGGGSLRIVDMLRALQKSADARGGKVIVTMGNHEAYFLHEPTSPRSMRDDATAIGLGAELHRIGGSPVLVALGADDEGRGAWLRALPFAAKVNDYFFVHSGATRGLDAEGLTAAIRRSVARGGFGHEGLVGEQAGSLLGASDWKITAAEARKNAEALGVKHIVMGHDPTALGAQGTIAGTNDGALIKLDTGLGNGEGAARMLRIGKRGGTATVDEAGARARMKRR